MKKLLLILPLTIILLLGTAGTAFADEPEGIGARCGQAGKSNIGHLYLYEKDSDWNIVEEPSWGKMKYNLSGDELKFVFNGHDFVYDLETEQSYSLIYYPDPWPGDAGDGLIILGEGTVNEEGNVHIMGSIDTGDLPYPEDENEGAKIWLVLSDDLPSDAETNPYWDAWNPESYLFEYDLINFSDSGDESVKSNSGNSGKGPKPDKKDKPNKPGKPNK